MEQTKYIPEASPMPEVIKHDAALLVREVFGPQWQITDQVKLNHKVETQVARLFLQDTYNNKKTAILKYLESSFYTDKTLWQYFPNFFEEKANYKYLDSLRHSFSRFPEFYSAGRGMFLIKDLGPDDYIFENDDAIINGLAETFVMLHTATQHTEEPYQQAREKSGLGIDNRRYSPAGCGEAFDRACGILLDFCSVLNIPETGGLVDLLRQVRMLIMEKNVFWSFVHDDLADRRQCVVQEGKIILLDFEHGKFFHRLIDLAKLLIGKVEQDHNRKGMFHHHPNVPTSLGEKYFELWQKYDVSAPLRSEWEVHFAAANIFQAMMTINRLSELNGPDLLYSMAGTLRSIIQRLIFHLDDNGAFHELRACLLVFTNRIMI